MKILIVDDEPNVRILLQEILEPYGSCDLVISGDEAVAIFEAELHDNTPYTLVLMDIMMPRMDGQKALKRIRQLEREHGVSPQDEVVVIMISALNTPTAMVEAYGRSGCTDYVTKPFTPEQLLEKLRKHRLLA